MEKKSKARMIEVCVVEPVPPSSYNHDISGYPKTASINKVIRGYLSPQTQKYAIRHDEDFISSNYDLTNARRSALLSEYICDEIDSEFLTVDLKSAIVNKCKNLAKKEDKKDSSSNVIMVLPVEYFDVIIEVFKEFLEKLKYDASKFKKIEDSVIKERIKTLVDERGIKPGSQDTSIFGSMVLSDLGKTIPASMYVAPAFTTGEVIIENDFFIASDDYVLEHPDKAKGAANLGDKPYYAACFYKYSAMDLDILRDNLTSVNCKSGANLEDLLKEEVYKAVSGFIHSLPKGGQTSYAAYGYPVCVCITVKDVKRPLNYAHAFSKPIVARNSEDEAELSVKALVQEMTWADEMYDVEYLERAWVCAPMDVNPENVTQYKSVRKAIEGIIKYI